MNLLIILIGSSLGSFFTLIAERSTIGLSSIYPSSHCTHCHVKLKIFDLIPVLSYLCLKGKCRYCHNRIPLLSTIIEIITPLLLIIIYQTNHFNMYNSAEILILFTSIILSVSDIIYLSFSPHIFFIGYGTALLLYLTPYYHNPLHLYTALMLYLSSLIGTYLSEYKIGLGDIKIICFLSLVLTFYSLIELLFYASLFALVYYFYLYTKKVSIINKRIPFVPFLTLGYLIIFIT